MGQKVHPLIQRIGINKDWSSRWFAERRQYSTFLKEDIEIRKFIKNRFMQAAVARIVIERLAAQMRIKIFSARPGIIIGRHGADIDRLREDLKNITNKDMLIDIEEIKNPFAEAQLVAENVSFQLEKRVAFKRAMKRCMEQAMKNGAKGIRIAVAGRLGGSEMSRREGYKMGKVPLQTLRADIDYGFTEAHTTYGTIGVKVWVYKGDSVLTREEESRPPKKR